LLEQLLSILHSYFVIMSFLSGTIVFYRNSSNLFSFRNVIYHQAKRTDNKCLLTLELGTAIEIGHINQINPQIQNTIEHRRQQEHCRTILVN
jgi:hypothetical protein